MAAPAIAVDKVTYEDLYERWEVGNWRSTEIDFAVDRRHWQERFSDFERRAALWNYSLFFHGEDAVADGLSPYIDAAPREEHKYFLATQQADEARHAVFFGRFMREVVGRGTDIGSSLAATESELTWGFRKVFSRLERMAQELRRDRSRTTFARAVALYHLVIEGALAQPGQHFIERYLEERDLLPGFREGMRRVSLDEQRHIAFGVKILADLVREDPEVKDAVADLLREVMPWTIGVFVPPNHDRRYTECFGFTLEEIFAQGTEGFEVKMRAAGLPLEELPGASPFPPGMPPPDRADRALKMLEAGLMGEKTGPPSRDPEALALHFETLRHSIDHAAAPPDPTTIQWDFDDAESWHLRIDNGATSAARGRADRPDLVLACRFEDWIDIANRREDPRRALLDRRLRLKGSPRALWRTRKLFA